MITHTQGKWKAEGCTIYSGKTVLAVTYCEGNRELHPNMHEKDTPPDSDGEEHGDGWEEAWKNAELIAAAPELLAHLKMLVMGISEGIDIPKNGAAIAAALDIIAKVENNA
jgi:hypothetical protein